MGVIHKKKKNGSKTNKIRCRLVSRGSMGVAKNHRDSETIEDTYQDWLTGAVKRMEELIKEGYETVEIDFDVDKFNDWCQNNEKVPNGESRSEYTAQLLRINDQFSSN